MIVGATLYGFSKRCPTLLMFARMLNGRMQQTQQKSSLSGNLPFTRYLNHAFAAFVIVTKRVSSGCWSTRNVGHDHQRYSGLCSRTRRHDARFVERRNRYALPSLFPSCTEFVTVGFLLAYTAGKHLSFTAITMSHSLQPCSSSTRLRHFYIALPPRHSTTLAY